MTVAGTAYLGVDPFSYFERFHNLQGMPDLVYTWRIESIVRQTAPFIDRGEGILVRDPSKLGWMPLDETDAWHDDNGFAEYVLTCTLLDVPPKRSSATAT